ncbi:phenylacetate--CoA ligase family protein [Planococcus sp. YIM B11945]|uniref:phenylacetate--CoA ligase family protein n=1 Tax=Planococcus sp. YIM B11945 TaxID=3435410 RepID=UPI003D7CB148
MNDLKMKIYNHSPIHIQNLLTSLAGYWITKSRYSRVYYAFLKELERMDFTNAAAEQKHQEVELQQLIRHAVQNSSFYQKFYKGIDIESIKTLEDLKKLPILEPETARQNIESMYTIRESAAVVSYTSGTSGTPLKFLFTKEDHQKRMAFLDFFKKQHGVVNLQMKRASISAQHFIPKNQQKKVFWRDNHSSRQRLYSAYYCTEKSAQEVIENFELYRPDFIDGLPSAIYELAKWINQRKITLSFRPIAIFTTAETLYPLWKKEIEEAFGCPVRNQYATPEGSPFITECPKGNLHYNMRSGIIETTDEGNMIVTGFNTYGTPIIRYNIGDRLEFPRVAKRCECGSAHPVLEEVQGWSDDFLQAKCKRKISPFYFSMASGHLANAIKKMQFIQNSLEAIDVLIEGDVNYTNSMTEVVHEQMEYVFGTDMVFNIRIVEQIPIQPNGKFKLVINNIT